MKLGIFVVAGRLELEPYTAKPSLTVLVYFQISIRCIPCARKVTDFTTFDDLTKLTLLQHLQLILMTVIRF